MANMIHPLTGSDYVAEQAFNDVVTKAKAEFTTTLEAAADTAVGKVLGATIDTKVGTAITTADIPGAINTAIALLPLPAVTVADTAPTTPVDGHIWIDTTGDTEVLNIYSGTAWLVVTATPAT